MGYSSSYTQDNGFWTKKIIKSLLTYHYLPFHFQLVLIYTQMCLLNLEFWPALRGGIFLLSGSYKIDFWFSDSSSSPSFEMDFAWLSHKKRVVLVTFPIPHSFMWLVRSIHIIWLHATPSFILVGIEHVELMIPYAMASPMAHPQVIPIATLGNRCTIFTRVGQLTVQSFHIASQGNHFNLSLFLPGVHDGDVC